VIEAPGGFIAGPVEGGMIRPSEERSVNVRAFDIAAQAARRASREFAAAGNKESARLYARKAELLAKQLD
jgi:hypothetical protein